MYNFLCHCDDFQRTNLARTCCVKMIINMIALLFTNDNFSLGTFIFNLFICKSIQAIF